MFISIELLYRHDIAETLLKVALNTVTLTPQLSYYIVQHVLKINLYVSSRIFYIINHYNIIISNLPDSPSKQPSVGTTVWIFQNCHQMYNQDILWFLLDRLTTSVCTFLHDMVLQIHLSL